MRPTTFVPYSTQERNPVEVLGDRLSQDLGDNTPMTDKSWAHSLYLKVTTPENIEKFLKASGEYENGRWARVPQTPSSSAALRQPFCGLVNTILGCLASGAAALRMAVNTHISRFEGPLIEGTQHRCTPGIVVKGSGPSFTPPKGPHLGFSNVATCFDTQLDKEAEDYSHHLAYHAAYAKHIFARQPNRVFVRSLVITENRACLFHFDRSGAQYTPLFNIHDEPATFVRLILGLCSADERTLGFDDTVWWSVAADGSRAEGTVRTIGPDGTTVTYQLVTDEVPFTRNNLCGRGTTCWAVKDAEGNRLIVKDCWVSEGQDSEIKLLGEAKGLRGVCQMVSYEENRFQTKDLRGNVGTLEQGTFRNRTSTRIVMKAYGPSIQNFTSVIQVLAALRDAIAAHRLLFSKNIIHRDISPNNILLGEVGAGEGIRGILIDFDLAFKCDVFGPDRAHHTNGTRPFQSLMVLKTSALKPHNISAHDYLDDLESFFWVFSYLLIVYKADGTPAPKTVLHEYLDSWNAVPAGASRAKFTFLFQATIGDDVLENMDEGWRHACADLFLNFRKYVRDIADRKDALLYEPQGTEEEGAFPNRFSSILKDVDKHYDHVLALLDEALEKATEAMQPESLTSPAMPSPTPAGPQTPVKGTSLTSSPQPSQSSVSTQSTLVTPSISSSPSSLAAPSSPNRPPKRRCQEAELEDPCIELKRQCPPSRQPLLRAVVEPSLYVLNSFYQYCLKWL